MKNWIAELTVISITYNNGFELGETINSITPLLQYGASSIIINGGSRVTIPGLKSFKKQITIVEEKDKGRYDAINKGIKLVKTDYFMLIHSGDKFISSPKIVNDIIKELNYTSSKLFLGNQFIDFQGIRRKHTITFWYPFMINLGAQPPHLPIIYDSQFTKNQEEYSLDYEIISDHLYLNNLFSKKPKYIKSNLFLIHMNGGGATSSGIKSFFRVSEEFLKHYGIFKGVIISVARIPFKILQML